MGRWIEFLEDDVTRKLSLSSLLAIFITAVITILVFIGLFSGYQADYTLLGFLMSGYSPYVGKKIGQGIQGRKNDLPTDNAKN